MNPSLKNRMAEFLDIDQVEELRSIPGEGQLDLFADVTALFLRTTPELFKKLEQALQEGDRTTAARQAHMLKGSSSNLGAFSLSEKSHQLEQAALQDGTELRGLFEETRMEYGKLQVILQEVLREPPSQEQT